MKVKDKKPFVSYTLEEDQEETDSLVIATKWNKKELELLIKAGLLIRQSKKSTIIKMLAKIGFTKVLNDQKLINTVLDSYRRNKRLGIESVKVELKRNFRKSNTNVDEIVENGITNATSMVGDEK